MNNNYGAIYQPYSSQYRPDTAILSQAEKDKLIEEEVAKRKAAESKRKSGFLPKTAEQLSSPYRAGQTISASGQQVGGIIGDVGKASYDGVVGGYKGLYDLAAPVVEGAGNLGRGVLGMREDTEEGFRYANQPQQSQAQPQGASEADLSALAKYRPDGILKNAQDIDMGGKGVLRPDEPNTHTMPDGTVMEGATHEEYEQANPPTNPVLNPIETPNKPINKNGILQNIGQAITENDGTGSATNNSRSNTATAQEIKAKKEADARRNEMLIRVGGAIAGGARQGGLAAMSAGAQEYGAIQDQNRLNQMSMLSKLQAMNKPTVQQEKQAGENRETFINTQSMSQRQSFLAKRLRQEGNNVTGMVDGTAGAFKDNMLGNPRAELRLSLEQEAVNATLVSVALTKGAISNREMELFMKPIPKIGINQEATWIAWLEMQSALNAIKAKRYDPNNVNLDGSLKSRVQADAEASAELEQLYQNLLDTGYEEGGGQSEPNEADSVADKYL
tara:strand:+ start:539 stop:2044 length:1506 start_codon:yes stop_codon:yes gene_type:complete